MKVAVIGLGSMGKRRIRLLKKFDSCMEIYGVDLQEDRCKESAQEYGIFVTTNLDELLTKENLTCAFITTSPCTHASIVNKCLTSGLHVFTELNLVQNGYEENINLSKKMNKVLFLSSTLLYRKEIQYISKLVKSYTKTLRYQYHVGQYLPDWHPWESYRNFFVAKKETNACREIMAIEFPWLVQTFGQIIDLKVHKSKLSSLDLDYPDNYIIYIKHETGHEGVFCVDIISRMAQRELKILGEEIYLLWDGQPSGLKQLDINKNEMINVSMYQNVDKLDNYSDNIIENAYYNEIEDFFNAIEQRSTPIYSYSKDREILNIIDRIEGIV